MKSNSRVNVSSPSLHKKNKHQGRYDFDLLKIKNPELKKYIINNKFNGEETIDFSDANAVKELNRSLLKMYYNLDFWDIPHGFLCPPIPGRADYIHHLSELVTKKSGVKVLDIGTGANCIYPLIGVLEYGWNFVGSDIELEAINSARQIVCKNNLQDKIEVRIQGKSKSIFNDIIKNDEYFDLTMCNPPFHASKEEALESMIKKNRNLKIKPKLNFGGKSNELWCDGGEASFIRQMIAESESFKNQVEWFTSLVSKKDTLPLVYSELEKQKISQVKTIEMGQGQKISRFVAWKF